MSRRIGPAGPEDRARIATEHCVLPRSRAVSTFITNLVVKSADDADSGWTGAHVKALFRERYLRHHPGQPHQAGCYYFKKGSEAERWVHSDPFESISGWGFTARLTRAEKIAERFGTPDRVP